MHHKSMGSPVYHCWLLESWMGGVLRQLSLWVQTVVMGTKFLGANKSELEPDVREEVFVAVDVGQSTARSRVWDEVWAQALDRKYVTANAYETPWLLALSLAWTLRRCRTDSIRSSVELN